MTTPQYTQQQLDTGQQCLHGFLTKPTVAGQYADVLQQNQTNTAAVAAWLAGQGYANIDPVCIYIALEQMRATNLAYWSGFYDNEIVTDGKTLQFVNMYIQGGAVVLDQGAVKDPNYLGSRLSWSTAPGNTTAGTVQFMQVTGVTNQPLPAGSYIGPQFSGAFFDGSTEFPTWKGNVSEWTLLPPGEVRVSILWQKIIQYVGYTITVGAGLQLGYRIGPWIWSQAATLRASLEKLNPQGEGMDPQTLNNSPPSAGGYTLDDPVVDPVVTTDVTAEVVEVAEVEVVEVDVGHGT